MDPTAIDWEPMARELEFLIPDRQIFRVTAPPGEIDEMQNLVIIRSWPRLGTKLQHFDNSNGTNQDQTANLGD